jgi:hypothetical protein
MQDWSEDEAEEDASTYMLNPQRKERADNAGGSTPPVKGPQEGQTPPVGLTPSVRTAEEEARPPPQDGGQGSSTQRPSQGQPRCCAFTTIHQSSDL